jgi:hypothetical protein
MLFETNGDKRSRIFELSSMGIELNSIRNSILRNLGRSMALKDTTLEGLVEEYNDLQWSNEDAFNNIVHLIKETEESCNSILQEARYLEELSPPPAPCHIIGISLLEVREIVSQGS